MFSATPAYDNVSVEIEGVRQNIIVFGLMVPAVVPDATDILYTVPQAGQGRTDLISQQFYGTPELWWVLALVNNQVDPLLGFVTNQTIRVPTKERLASEGILTV
jgi:hypothetical protein